MKKNTAYICLLFFPALFSAFRISGQVIGAAQLSALTINGKIAVHLDAAAYKNLNNYFLVGANGLVSADFYFQPDDPRNGTYTSTPSPQFAGGANLVFNSLNYNSVDDLSFGMITHLMEGGIREYIFIGGNYSPPSGPGEVPCPTNIFLHQQGWLIFKFNPSEFIVGSNNLPTSVNLFFGEGNPANGTYNIAPAPGANNGFYLPYNNFNQGNGVPPVNTLLINGRACRFQGGVLNNDPNCSSLSDVYTGFEECADYFEACTSALLEILMDHKDDIACSQWASLSACSSSAKIDREGKVAIGTSGFSSSTLTVKGGVITDKVKVQTCAAGGWCDYVFEKGYPLMPLDKVDAYIRQYGHLPGIPSGTVIEAEGAFELGSVTYMHQEKIEEIFLHLIALEKEIDEMEAELAFLQYMKKSSVK